MLIMSLYLVFPHQNMWTFVFWTPCMAKTAFYWLGLSIYEKGSQNAPHQKGKTFQETQYFDHAHTSHFFPPKSVDFSSLDTLYS